MYRPMFTVYFKSLITAMGYLLIVIVKMDITLRYTEYYNKNYKHITLLLPHYYLLFHSKYNITLASIISVIVSAHIAPLLP